MRPVCPNERHEAIKVDDQAWSSLESRGSMRIEADETGPAEDHEFANCTCGSTLVRVRRAA
jgi:hypothetical protein